MLDTSGLTIPQMIEDIKRLRKQRNAVILAHNYQIPEIQDIADYVGDSLGLSQTAARTEADVIAFCGVHFMAETASIICPNKLILIPDPNAGCSLADCITGDDVRRWKAEYPEAVVVCYINTTADVKAECDYCCTSSNAVKVVQAIPEDKEILFLPDLFLGSYVEKMTGRKMHIWMGECHVHAGIHMEDITKIWEEHPEAEYLIHPECGCSTSLMYNLAFANLDPNKRTFMYSTEGIIRHIKQSSVKEFIIGTEVGILHRLQKENPDKKFIPVKADAICEYMKMITVEKLWRSLNDMIYPVKVDEPIASRARLSIERMLAIV